MKIWGLVALGLALTSGGSGALSDEPLDAPLPPKNKKSSKLNLKKGHRVVKETEGTEAPNRFEADTVIKSQYELDGQSLEVDPD